jgi:hypothetical protein
MSGSRASFNPSNVAGTAVDSLFDRCSRPSFPDSGRDHAINCSANDGIQA